MVLMLYPITTFLFWLFFKIFYRYKVEYEVSQKLLPKGLIIAPNHTSYLDPPLVSGSWKGSLHFFAGSRLFEGWFLGFILPKINCHPVEKGKERATIRQAIALLKEGKNIVVFPEGTRSADGELLELKSGVAYISFMSGCPIVPCYIEGTYAAWPRGQKYPTFGASVFCKFGKPIYPTGEGSHEERERLTKLLEDDLKRLSV
jgi:1-acyl-sn-glycerol-3-phosphate acyltransferase